MIDIITMLVTFAVVAYFNIKFSSKIRDEVIKSVERTPSKIEGVTLDPLVVKEINELIVERHHDQYYFFMEKTDQFVGQGSSLEQAARHFTLLRGSDILGSFSVNNQKYCFINNECLPFERIR